MLTCSLILIVCSVGSVKRLVVFDMKPRSSLIRSYCLEHIRSGPTVNYICQVSWLPQISLVIYYRQILHLNIQAVFIERLWRKAHAYISLDTEP